MTSTEGTPAPQEANVLSCSNPTVHALLRKRARRAYRMSWGVLGFIILLLIGGAVMFIDPPKLLPPESFIYPNYDYSGTYWEDFDSVETKGSTRPKMTEAERGIISRLDEMQKRLDSKDGMDAEQDRKLEALESKNEGIEHQLGEIKRTVEERPKQEAKHWEVVLGVFATRFGIAALVVLLMRFMSSIYRYHARMAAFYDAKADVFEACKEGDVQTMEKLSHMLTPVAVDFYETSDTIVEHAVDLAKRAASSNA